MKTAGIVVATLVGELILMILFINSGFYNVSTMSPDPGFLHYVFGHTSDVSAADHSKGIAVPSLSDSSMIIEGYHEYHQLCEVCHAGPGITRSDISKGLYPHPPDLVRSAKELPANRLFWVAKNGIKSTAMPGFGWTHSDKQIWAVVAFLEKMKNMTPQEYAAMSKPPVKVKEADMRTRGRSYERRR